MKVLFYLSCGCAGVAMVGGIHNKLDGLGGEGMGRGSHN